MTSTDPFLDPMDTGGEGPAIERSAPEPASAPALTSAPEPSSVFASSPEPDLLPVSESSPPQSSATRSGIGGRLIALVAAASLASASLAAAATAAIVGVGQATPATTAAATTGMTAVTASTNGSSSSTTGESIVAIASAATPAVVTIDTTVSTSGPFGGSAGGTGSGFIYDSSGLILTNDHVIEGADQITVTLLDGRHFDGTVVTTDATLDLAIVKVKATGLPTVTLGTSDELEVGETLIAIGSPLGTYTGSVTSGILSATGRTITVADEITRRPHQLENLLQTDAAINPGNSGGPIIDLAGHVVGIATATSTSAEGLGFAVPITAATRILASVKGTST